MLYKLFASLKTSVLILSFMCLIFLIGTIFPQGKDIEDYIKAGGKYVALVKNLNLLDVFMSPLFIFLTGMLLINLAVCLYGRLKVFLKIKRMPVDFERLKTHPRVVIIENYPSPYSSPRGGEGRSEEVEERLKEAGFKLKAEAQTGRCPRVKIFEKGLQYWWLSWFYHLGIMLAIFGFFLTSLFAFEKGVVLYPDKPETISLYSKETRWNRFSESIGMELPEKQQEDEYVLTLKEFRTEYYQGLRIDYPEDKLERIAMGLGIKEIEPSKKGFSYMPKMWVTRLSVKKPDGEVVDAEIRVNKPFRIGGLTLYQMGYEQKIKLSVYPAGKKASPLISNEVNGEIINVEARKPFEVKDVKGSFVIGLLKLGTLFKRDGTTERINPVTTVYYISEENHGEPEPLGELNLGGSLAAKSLVFKFKDYKEGSYLSYRKDPGVWLVGLACLFVFIGLFVRSLGAWYRVQYAVENKTAYILISSRGILADKDRIIKKLQR